MISLAYLTALFFAAIIQDFRGFGKIHYSDAEHAVTSATQKKFVKIQKC